MCAACGAAYGRLMTKHLALAAAALLSLTFPSGTAQHWAGETPACGHCPRPAGIIVINPGKPSCSLCPQAAWRTTLVP
jgi:hypothetical protein